MSSEVFPALRISPDGFTREPYFDTTIQKTRDGSELRIDWGGSGIRYEFTVRTVGATENSALLSFFNARRGRFDTFFFTDPSDGVQRYVRFGEDSLAGRKIGPDVTEYRVTLETVGGA